MRFLLDIRPLLEPRRSGVGNYTAGLLGALLSRPKRPDLDYVLWANAFRRTPPTDLPQNAEMKLTGWPNKLLNAVMSLTGRPALENLTGGADALYLPNLNFLATAKPYAVTIHDLSFVRYPHFFSPKQRLWHAAIRPRRLLRRATAVIAVSEHTKNDIVETYGIAPEKIVVITPAANHDCRPVAAAETAGIQAKYGLKPPYFLCVGTVEPRKNLQAAIRAFANLDDRRAQLVIVGGDGYQAAAVRAAAHGSPATDRIRFLDHVVAADLPALYTGAVGLVYPSFYEGFGMPPLEAMACGTPVIASQVSSLSEVVGDAGLLIDPHRDADITDAMSALLRDPKLRATLSGRGLERAKRYSWEKSAERLERLLSSLK